MTEVKRVSIILNIYRMSFMMLFILIAYDIIQLLSPFSMNCNYVLLQ